MTREEVEKNIQEIESKKESLIREKEKLDYELSRLHQERQVLREMYDELKLSEKGISIEEALEYDHQESKIWYDAAISLFEGLGLQAGGFNSTTHQRVISLNSLWELDDDQVLEISETLKEIFKVMKSVEGQKIIGLSDPELCYNGVFQIIKTDEDAYILSLLTFGRTNLIVEDTNLINVLTKAKELFKETIEYMEDDDY
jgi:hypothetical protein